MLRTVTVRNNQSFFDIAMQELGSAELAFDLAAFNNMSATDDLITGQLLNVDSDLTNVVVLTFIKENRKPATAATINPALTGIEYWAIEQDFLVS